MARGLSSALLAVALLAGGCADDPTLDPDSVSEGLIAVLFPSDPTIPTDISCPDPDPEIIAQPLTCTALLHGETITIDVDIDEDGAATAEIRERLLALSDVAELVRDRVAADIEIAPTVECPGLFVVDRSGVAFECTASHDGRPLVLKVEIIDDDSTWTVSYLP